MLVVERSRGVLLMKGLGGGCFVKVSVMLLSNKNVKTSYPGKEFPSVRS